MTKLTAEELAFIRKAHKSCEQPSAVHVDRERLLDHIDAITAELAQARTEVAALKGQLQAAADAAGHWLRDTAPAVQEVLSETVARAGGPQRHRPMTKEQFDNLRPGDVVQHLASGAVCSVLRKRGDVGYDVTGRGGISIPSRWALVSSAAAPQSPAQEDSAIAALRDGEEQRRDAESRIVTDMGLIHAVAPRPPAQPVAVPVDITSRAMNDAAWAFLDATPAELCLASYAIGRAWPKQALCAAITKYLSAINARPEAVVKAEVLREEAGRIGRFKGDTAKQMAVSLLRSADRLNPPGDV